MSSRIGESFEKLVAIVARLRDPRGGCPWDLKQTHESLKPYIIEECYEVIDAIERSPQKLHEELGDVLLQIVLHAQLAGESGSFDICRVIDGISEKLIRRHPHVFAETKVDGAEEVLRNWEEIKRNEKDQSAGMLEDIPRSLPALLKAQRIGEKVGRVGFDWDNCGEIAGKVSEEIEEFLESADRKNYRKDALQEEFGDLLFTLVQLARKMNFNAEEVLDCANAKFCSRFRQMEVLAGKPLKDCSKGELESLWQRVKG